MMNDEGLGLDGGAGQSRKSDTGVTSWGAT